MLFFENVDDFSRRGRGAMFFVRSRFRVPPALQGGWASDRRSIAVPTGVLPLESVLHHLEHIPQLCFIFDVDVAMMHRSGAN